MVQAVQRLQGVQVVQAGACGAPLQRGSPAACASSSARWRARVPASAGGGAASAAAAATAAARAAGESSSAEGGGRPSEAARSVAAALRKAAWVGSAASRRAGVGSRRVP